MESLNIIENKMCTMVVPKPTLEKIEQGSIKSRCRKWTEEEVGLFAAILADNKFGFAIALESLAAKKSSNTDLFTHVKHVLDQALNEGDFKEINGKKKFRTSNVMKSYELIDTSVEKLRKKYSNLKSEWRRRSELGKTMGGADLDKEPRWFSILNSVFGSIGLSDTININHQPMHMVYPAEQHNGKYLSDVPANINEHPRNQGNPAEQRNTSESTKDAPAEDELIVEFEERGNEVNEMRENVNGDVIEKSNTRPKTFVRIGQSSHRKRKMLSSPMQALCEIAKGMQELAASQLRINQLVIENELKRDEMFYKFCTEQAEKNRAHELRLTELYTSVLSKSKELPPVIPIPLHSQINNFPSTRRRSMVFEQTRGEYNTPMTSYTSIDNETSNTNSTRIESSHTMTRDNDG